MADYNEVFVGIDTSKLRNAVAIAEGGRNGEVRYLGEIENRGGDEQAGEGYRCAHPGYSLLERIWVAKNLIEHMPEFKLVAAARGNIAATIGCLELPPLLDVRPIEQLLGENRHSNDKSSGALLTSTVRGRISARSSAARCFGWSDAISVASRLIT